MSVQIACTECGVKIKAPEKAIGKRVKCPKCKQPFVAVPTVASSAARAEETPKAPAEPSASPANVAVPHPADPVPHPADPLPPVEPAPEAAPAPLAEAPDPVETPGVFDSQTVDPSPIEQPEPVEPEPEPEPVESHPVAVEPESIEPDESVAPPAAAVDEPPAAEPDPFAGIETGTSADAADDDMFAPNKFASEAEAHSSEAPSVESEPAAAFVAEPVDVDPFSAEVADADPIQPDVVTPVAVAAVAGAGAAATPMIADTADDDWAMMTPDGEEYGPISKADLDVWVAEERVDAECKLRNTNDGQWQPAALFYPQLMATAAEVESPFAAAVESEVPVDANPVGELTGGIVDTVGDAASSVGDAASDATTSAFGVAAAGAGAIAATGAAGMAAAGSFVEPEIMDAPVETAVAAVVDGAPAESATSQAFTGAFPESLTNAITKTRPWCLLTSAMFFLGTFAALLYAAYMWMYGRANYAANSMAPFLLMGVSALIGVVFIVLALVLLGYAKSCKSFAKNPNMETLTAAAKSQHGFWKLAGIILLLLIVLAGLSPYLAPYLAPPS